MANQRAAIQPSGSLPTSPDTPGLDSDGSERATESDSLLSVRESPILGVQTLGPRQIMIGKESAYQVAIRNTGKVAAERVVVTIDLPEWAEVVGADPSKGATDWRTARVEAGRLQWEVGQLAGGDEEKLALRIVPRQSRPFDLAVKWDYTPVVSQAMIEVQEPKLQMRLDGPSEVLFGQSQTYRLELANSGTGDAEDLEVSLAVVGAGQNVPATHKLARLAAGQKRLIEVELTARRAGTLTIQVDARGASGLEGHVAKEVTVKRPALELSVEAPELQYVGAEATYRICVSNPGTAAAQHVVVTAALPSGVRYLSNVGGGQVAPDQGKVTWTLESLGVGAKETVELRCRLAQAGLSRVEAGATAGGGLTASGDATVKVEAMADLALELDDPTGPVPVGSGATYQVRVHNRGTKSADEVEVVVYFSRGLEPVSAEGGRHQTAPGQVLFDKIPSLAAGQDATFRVKAEASEPGSHVCRVEVYCRPLGTRLVSEETTHFYGPTH